MHEMWLGLMFVNLLQGKQKKINMPKFSCPWFLKSAPLFFFSLAKNFGSLDSYCHTQQRKGRSTLHVVQTKEHQVFKLTSFPETGNFVFHMFTVFEAKIKNSQDFLHRSMLSGSGLSENPPNDS
jgi:hypothetical protein